MIKKVLAFLLTFAICILSPICAYAYTSQYVFDDTNQLYYDEIQELESIAEQIEYDYGYCVMFCITDQEADESYAQDIYDTYTDNENGIIFVHDTENEAYCYYVTSSAKSQLDSNAIADMQDAYDASATYFGGVEDYYTVAKDLLLYGDAPVDTDAQVLTISSSQEQGDESGNPVVTVIICIVAGMAVGFGVMLLIASKNKSVKMQANATVYTRPGSFVVTGSYDNFLYKNLDKTPKPKQENKR